MSTLIRFAHVPRFAANLTMLFAEVDFLDRFSASCRAGFRGVEYLFPYAYDKELLRERLEVHGLTQVLFNLPAGNWEAGERGIACHPGRAGEFQDGVGQAIEYAAALGCKRVNCLAGVLPRGTEPQRAHEVLHSNLQFAAAKLGEAGIELLIEPVNTRDVPGFFIHHTRQARALIDELGLGLQYDIYHMQIMEGDLTGTIEQNLDVIRHIQIADHPGRHEPGTGEINFPFVFSFLDAAGYQGWVGCEYKPETTTAAGLSWLRPYLETQGRDRPGSRGHPK